MHANQFTFRYKLPGFPTGKNKHIRTLTFKIFSIFQPRTELSLSSCIFYYLLIRNCEQIIKSHHWFHLFMYDNLYFYVQVIWYYTWGADAISNTDQTLFLCLLKSIVYEQNNIYVCALVISTRDLHIFFHDVTSLRRDKYTLIIV